MIVCHILKNSSCGEHWMVFSDQGCFQVSPDFIEKEAVHGRKVLAMDNLLAGKTRKEASRMFFETLVLKTRDYIHVEQAKPFDNLNIKPRVKLMKSDF
ncbi:hypothetical protein SLA2020_407030 [Shorea laevis]